nr:unnamed protein product [Callosobruchus chinensis]
MVEATEKMIPVDSTVDDGLEYKPPSTVETTVTYVVQDDLLQSHTMSEGLQVSLQLLCLLVLPPRCMRVPFGSDPGSKVLRWQRSTSKYKCI